MPFGKVIKVKNPPSTCSSGLLKLLILKSQKGISGTDHCVLPLSLCPSLNIHKGCHLRWHTGLERPMISLTRAFVIWSNGKIHPRYDCGVPGKERVYWNCVKNKIVFPSTYYLQVCLGLLCIHSNFGLMLIKGSLQLRKIYIWCFFRKRKGLF